MSMVQQAVEVGAPVHTVYEQITRFEDYPRFMTGVERVTPIGTDRTRWVMDVDGHRREFDAQVTELAPDERVSWTTTDGPLLAETITLRPMGEKRTQVVARLEADIAYLMPSDRHGPETLNRRLKDDLMAFKGLVESGAMSGRGDLASPASVANRISRRIGSGSAPMGGRRPAKDSWGDGMINEADRGSAHDF
jgi:uncharacterized membrane protein